MIVLVQVWSKTRLANDVGPSETLHFPNVIDIDNLLVEISKINAFLINNE